MKIPSLLLFSALLCSCSSFQSGIQSGMATAKNSAADTISGLKDKTSALFQDDSRIKVVEADPSRYLPQRKSEPRAGRKSGPILVRNTTSRRAVATKPVDADLPPLPTAELPPLPTAAELKDSDFPGILPALDEPLPKFDDDAA